MSSSSWWKFLQQLKINLEHKMVTIMILIRNMNILIKCWFLSICSIYAFEVIKT